MNRFFFSTAIGLCVLSGCAGKAKNEYHSAPPSAGDLENIRSAYKTTFPLSRVGRVTAVLGDQPYAMVGDVDTADIHERDAITFLDGSQQVIAHGEVIKVDGQSVAVQFDAGMRRPVVGDAAIKF